MKFKMKKIAATALAAAMCVPCAVSAADTQGSFDTSFDIYSPVLTVSVPTTLDIRINPLANAGEEITSNSIDIINASVDVDEDTAIPVNATIKATIASKGEDVIAEYASFTPSATSAVKKVYMTLEEAKTDAILDLDNATFASGETLLDLSTVEVKTDAVYDGSGQKATITTFGSLLSVDIAGPTSGDTTDGSFIKQASDVEPAVGSFAITGVANAGADWKSTDLAVNVTYEIKASKARNITTPSLASGVTFTSGTSATDLTITLTGVGEATVVAMALHNDSVYGDFPFDEAQYTVDYASSNATITLPKDDAVLAFLAGDDFKGEAQGLVIALSDGRIVTTTLTVN